jgi:hypothetical protein
MKVHPKAFCFVFDLNYRSAKGHLPQILEQLKAENLGVMI